MAERVLTRNGTSGDRTSGTVSRGITGPSSGLYDRDIAGRVVSDQPAGPTVEPGPLVVNRDALNRVLIGAGLLTTPEERARLFPPTPGSGGPVVGEDRGPVRFYPGEGPLDILSDLFLRTFGGYESNAVEPSYSVVPQVLDSGGGSSRIGLILLVLVGAGAGIYYFYFRRSS